MASDYELARVSHFQRLAIATRALGLSRREIPNWMADVIYGYRGLITWPGGKAFIVGDDDIDAVFNDDGSFRWLSDFVNFAERAPRQKPQERVIERLRLIDLAFRISDPRRAELIAR
ncbi:hypothetical protein [Methyloligella halotolerans]|uniref:hypothetical protein n=1 Tax=Methyloligella halotolerans TaxID=1177755 RepID=UPI00083D0969|nr:hypothetical protein [Methyloligella halotolerans]